MKTFLYILSVSLLLASCSINKKTTGGSKLSYEAFKKFENEYIDATVQKTLGNYDLAKSGFLSAIEIDAQCHACLYQLGSIAFVEKNYISGLDYAKRAFSMNKTFNFWYAGELAQFYHLNGMYEESAKLFEEISNRQVTHEKSYKEATHQYINALNYNSALRMISKYEAVFGISEWSAQQASYLFSKLNKKDKSIEALEKLCKAYPEQLGYKGYLADAYLSAGRTEEAIVILEEMAKDVGAQGRSHFRLSEIYSRQGNHKKAYESLNTAFMSNDLDIHSKLQAMAPYFLKIKTDTSSKNEALSLAKILERKYPDNEVVAILIADLQNNLNNKLEARKYYLKASELNPNDYRIWNKIMLINKELEDNESQVEVTKQVIDLFPMSATSYIFLSYALFNQGNYEDALRIIEEGEQLATEMNDILELQISKAACYDQLQNSQESDKILDKILEAHPDNHRALNNYAYSLSLRKKNLVLALEKVSRALTLSPNNSNYLDTKAWVLYQMGKPSEAIELLKTAHNINPLNVDILTHLGDINADLGNIEKALYYYRKAQLINNDPSIQKRIYEISKP